MTGLACRTATSSGVPGTPRPRRLSARINGRELGAPRRCSLPRARTCLGCRSGPGSLVLSALSSAADHGEGDSASGPRHPPLASAAARASDESQVRGRAGADGERATVLAEGPRPAAATPPPWRRGLRLGSGRFLPHGASGHALGGDPRARDAATGSPVAAPALCGRPGTDLPAEARGARAARGRAGRRRCGGRARGGSGGPSEEPALHRAERRAC